MVSLFGEPATEPEAPEAVVKNEWDVSRRVEGRVGISWYGNGWRMAGIFARLRRPDA